MKHEAFNGYVDKVTKLFSIDKTTLFSKTKKREVVDARQMLYYLCSVRPMRISYIQRYLEANGYFVQHTSIIHGIRAIKKRMSEDPDYISIVKKLS